MLTTKEAAKILGVTPETIYNYRKDGLVSETVNIGKRIEYRFKRQSIEDYKMDVLKYPYRVKFMLKKIHKVGEIFRYKGQTYKMVKLISIDTNTFEHIINVIKM